jgi:septal ring factor EnvC (AmiA/AmiB activator)
MRKAIATLAAVLALAFLDLPVGVSEASAQTAPRSRPKVTRKPKPRTPKARPPRPKAPDPKPSPTVVPLQSETGPSEPDVARLARVRARRQAVEQEILKLKSQADSTLRELETIDLDLRLAAHQFDEVELEFKETRRLLDATIRDVQTIKERLEVTRPRVRKSLGALSKLGELSYARLLFSLDDPADILRGYRYVSRIAAADGAQIKTFQTDLAQLSGLETQLKLRTAQNLETKRRLNEARTALQTRKAFKETRLAEIGQESQVQEQLADEYQKREAELLRILGEAGEAVPDSAPVAAPVPIAPYQPTTTLKSLRGDLPWPVRGPLLRKFGVERDPKFGTRTVQQGIEIDAYPENFVRAVHAGRVVYANQFIGYGMLVIIDHGHREHTLYGRLGELRVSPGDDVAAGALVGILPNTRITGSGLHFEVRVEGRPEDPQEWLKKP